MGGGDGDGDGGDGGDDGGDDLYPAYNQGDVADGDLDEEEVTDDEESDLVVLDPEHVSLYCILIQFTTRCLLLGGCFGWPIHEFKYLSKIFET